MTDHYELEMYNFLSKPENFRSMAKVAEHYPQVKKRLIEEFWDLVIDRIKQLDRSEKWEVIEHHPKWERWWGIQIEKKDWSTRGAKGQPGLFALRWEDLEYNPCLGLWVDAHQKDYDYSAAMEKVGIEKPYDFKSGRGPHWPFWQSVDHDFQNSNDLELILPGKRDELVNDFAERLWQLSEEYETKLDEMAILIRPSQ